MAEGFKGTQIGVFDLLLNEERLEFTVQYVSPDGVVHGLMQHKLPFPTKEEEPELAVACESLVQAIKAWTEKRHFNSTPGSSSRAVTPRDVRGISEAITRAEEDEDSAGFGQGSP